MAIPVGSKKERTLDDYIESYLIELEYLPSVDDKIHQAQYLAKSSILTPEQFLMQVILYLKRQQ